MTLGGDALRDPRAGLFLTLNCVVKRTDQKVYGAQRLVKTIQFVNCMLKILFSLCGIDSICNIFFVSERDHALELLVLC